MDKIIKSDIQEIEDTDLTPIEIALGVDGEGRTTAKKLYNFLELDESHYSRWIKLNILKNQFAEENVDFIPFALNGEDGGSKTYDYKLSASFAKKLAMGTHNHKGDEAQRYFIEVEYVLKKKALAERNTIKSLKSEITQIIDKRVEEKLNQVENKCSTYYKPSCATKFSIGKYIKDRLGINRANKEYDLVKQRIFIVLRAKKWEDISMDVLSSSMKVVDESIDVIKKDRPYQQMDFLGNFRTLRGGK